MESERLATILGFIIAAVVLAAAFFYVPIGSANKQAAPAAAPVAAPAAATPAPAAPRGPVIKEIPQQ